MTRHGVINWEELGRNFGGSLRAANEAWKCPESFAPEFRPILRPILRPDFRPSHKNLSPQFRSWECQAPHFHLIISLFAKFLLTQFNLCCVGNPQSWFGNHGLQNHGLPRQRHVTKPIPLGSFHKFERSSQAQTEDFFQQIAHELAHFPCSNCSCGSFTRKQCFAMGGVRTCIGLPRPLQVQKA